MQLEVPLEFPGLACHHIDIELVGAGPRVSADLVTGELPASADDAIVACGRPADVARASHLRRQAAGPIALRVADGRGDVAESVAPGLEPDA